MNVTIVILGIVVNSAYIAVLCVGDYRCGSCDCRLPISWFLRRNRHPASRTMWWIRSILVLVVAVSIVVPAAPWWLVTLWAFIVVSVWRDHWRHSKRRRRQLLRALGRVVVDAAGRLRIHPTPAPA